MRDNLPALSGYLGQPIIVTLADGQQVDAGTIVARAFAAYRGDNGNTQVAAETWNALTDGERQAHVEDTLAEWNAELQAGAAAVDTTNVLAAVGAEAAKQLGADLIDAALSEVKCLARPWQQMTADQQSDVLERITSRVRAAVGDTIRLLATQGGAHIVCELESITVKKGAKATLDVPKGELDQDLLDAVGASVILVVGPALIQARDIQAPKPDPDQADLLAQANLGNGDSGLVQHSDPED